MITKLKKKNIMAEAILSHALNSHVRPFNRISVQSTCEKIRGLTKPMKRIFFKNFKKPKTRKTCSSKKLGTLVHSQVEKVIKKQKLTRKKHEFTVQILNYLKAFKNLHSEVPLLSPSGYFLTYSDVICESHKGLTVISLKTGYNQSYNKGVKNCKHLKNLPNSYKSHHQLQLALEVACIEQDYGIKVHDAFVLYVGYGPKKKLKVDPLESWAKKKKMQKHLLECMNKKKKKMF